MSNVFWLLRVELRDFFKLRNCLQSRANAQNDNHFHSKRQPRTILGRVHFLLRYFSPSQIHLNYSVICPCFSIPSQKENLLNAFSNQNVGKYSTFSNGKTFSAPSQMEYMFYISRNLLRFFSMEIPSQLLLKWSTIFPRIVSALE